MMLFDAEYCMSIWVLILACFEVSFGQLCLDENMEQQEMQRCGEEDRIKTSFVKWAKGSIYFFFIFCIFLCNIMSFINKSSFEPNP